MTIPTLDASSKEPFFLTVKIQPEEVIGIKDETGSVSDHTFITAMGLLRVGYDTIVGNSDGDSIKDKVNRLLRI